MIELKTNRCLFFFNAKLLKINELCKYFLLFFT